MKLPLLATVIAFLVSAIAQASSLGPYLTDANGNVITSASLADANQLCLDLGQRLPTVREASAVAAEFGGALLEVSDYEAGAFPAGFTAQDFVHIKAAELFEDSEDEFYFASHAVNGQLQSYWIPTSSLQTAISTSNGSSLFYVWTIGNEITFDESNYPVTGGPTGAIRCIQ